MTAKKKLDGCCGAVPSRVEHPDHSAELNRLNRIKGQVEGVKRMVEERKYCPDILNQTSAIKAALIALESSILEKHLNACVRSALESKGGKSSDTITELLEIFKRSCK